MGQSVKGRVQRMQEIIGVWAENQKTCVCVCVCVHIGACLDITLRKTQHLKSQTDGAKVEVAQQ